MFREGKVRVAHIVPIHGWAHELDYYQSYQEVYTLTWIVLRVFEFGPFKGCHV